MNYYGVKVGRQPGIYKTWEECKAQVEGYSGAVFKKFKNLKEAEEFVGVFNRQEDRILDGNLDDNTLIAYVDGSFDSTNKSYSFGAVFINGQDINCYSKRFPEDEYSDHRNVSGEIRGAEFAFKYAIENGFTKLILHYDYEGIEKWSEKSWKTNKPLTKDYSLFFDEISKELEVEFVKVQAHSGDTYNEMADNLAKNADYKLTKEE